MPRNGLVLVLLLSVILAGCMATPEEQITQGIANAREAFQGEPEKPNEKVGKMDLYLPKGYDIEEPSDDYNSMITKGNDSFILFINPNEKGASTFFYDLQKADPEQIWIADETFRQHGRFGFVTVKEIAEDQLELVVSSGGAKMTTMTGKNDVPQKMEWMMETVRSINTDE